MKIEVFADIACPWCYIGEKRLREALARRPQIRAELEWRAFQLQPGIPREGLPWEAFMARKFGGAGNMQRAFAQVARVGAGDGLQFNFERVARAINTLDAHRLILWAAPFGKSFELAEAMFEAHFSNGRNLNALGDLLEVVASVGLGAEAAKDFLASGELEDRVEQDQQLAARFGIGGVPFFVFDRQYGLSGAQPLEVFLQVLDKVAEEQA